MKPGDLITPKSNSAGFNPVGLLLGWEWVGAKLDLDGYISEDSAKLETALVLEEGVMRRYLADNVRTLWEVINETR